MKPSLSQKKKKRPGISKQSDTYIHSVTWVILCVFHLPSEVPTGFISSALRNHRVILGRLGKSYFVQETEDRRGPRCNRPRKHNLAKETCRKGSFIPRNCLELESSMVTEQECKQLATFYIQVTQAGDGGGRTENTKSHPKLLLIHGKQTDGRNEE